MPETKKPTPKVDASGVPLLGKPYRNLSRRQRAERKSQPWQDWWDEYMAQQAKKREETRRRTLSVIRIFRHGITSHEENGQTAKAAGMRKLVEDLENTLEERALMVCGDVQSRTIKRSRG